MARATPELLDALRRTIDRLSGDTTYWWGHMGMCNCGHLAQSITGLTAREIHSSAMERCGDWEQQANQYCPASGLLIDSVLAAMFDLGLTRDDVRHLEQLSDPAVRDRLGRHDLQRNERADVIAYMRAWCTLLDEQRQPELRRDAVDRVAEVGHDERAAVDPPPAQVASHS